MTELTAIRQLCTFEIGDSLLGVDVREVQEVLRNQPMTPVPLASRYVSGLINLRGQIVLAVNLAECLSIEGRSDRLSGMLVVIRGDDGPVSFVVDRIRDIVHTDAKAFEPPPETLAASAGNFVLGAYELPDQLILLVDAHSILDFVSSNGSRYGTDPDDS